nr:immunoglobulin light chain junction region [Macaca mulatta]MOX53647.1 immunoglobulin light chain junction region [Macaca mulatta]MOX55546.1 immunoglobulin light chain junction region [Macaca mulatta]MOX55885.1 immunoglobulin light chain junction region [Macaca mulatta]MOX56416.1 immunoglobulin light chain junction region [Macaca mulatta]
CQHSSGTPYSF